MASFAAPRSIPTSERTNSPRPNLDAYALPALADVPIQPLSATTLNTFYAQLQEGAAWRGGKPLSVKSVRNIHSLISKVLADALDEGKVPRNVARNAKPPKLTKREMQIWTRDEMNAFLASVEGDRLFALWRLACRTGARRGELAGLRWEDIDFDAGEMSIRQSLVIVGTQARFQPPKTERSRRTIALDDATLAALKADRKGS
jgi:integrase